MKLNYQQGGDRPRKRWGKKYEPFDEGIYKLRVLEFERRAPRNGGAPYLNAAFEVEEGEHAGRRVWDQFNFEHANADVRQIAEERFDDLCKACGIFPISDTDQLVDRVFKARIKIEYSEGYDPKNAVHWYIVPKTKDAKVRAEHEQPYFPRNKAKAAATSEAESSSVAKKGDVELDDEIPFP
jgi:hypothetical protein